MRLSIFQLFFLSIQLLSAQTNQVPVISNLQANVQWSDGLISIHYDVFDAENDDLEIVVQLSDNAGEDFKLTKTLNAPSGDVGFPITAGTGKMITISTTGLAAGSVFVRLTALDRQPLDVFGLVAKIDSNALKNRLLYIEGIRHRTTGAAHLQAVRDSLLAHFDGLDLGLTTQDVPFTNYTGKNLMGTLYGTNTAEKTVIVDAHYDSVSNAPGADDNGSGVVGMMEIAEALAPYPSLNTVRYIGFDLEEAGLNGSTRYVSTFPGDEEILGVFNFEMIGYYSEKANTQTLPTGFNLLFPAAYNAVQQDSSRGNFLTNVGNTASQTLVDLFHQSAQTYVPDLRVIDVVAPGNGTIAPDLLRSDHAPFWLAGKKALMLTDGANFRNQCYHTDDDKAYKLNFGFMQQVTQATLASVVELAEVQHGSWQLVEAVQTLISENPTGDCVVDLWKNGVGIQLKIGDCAASGPAVFQVFSTDGKQILEADFSLKNNSERVFEGVFSSKSTYFARILNKNGVLLWSGKF